MKLCLCCCVSVDSGVAPFAGAWIEIDLQDIMLVKNYVAPFAGAWIEIAVVKCNMQYRGSLRSPERGLKSFKDNTKLQNISRSVRRSVD